ncbi:excalibur calcium-binding domain-containing protein [Mesorhizobium sp. ANAO-SY3R2]
MRTLSATWRHRRDADSDGIACEPYRRW